MKSSAVPWRRGSPLRNGSSTSTRRSAPRETRPRRRRKRPTERSSGRERMRLEKLHDPAGRPLRKDVAAGMDDEDDRCLLGRGVAGAAVAAGLARRRGAVERAHGFDRLDGVGEMDEPVLLAVDLE